MSLARVLRFELRAVLVTILASTIILVGLPITTPAVHGASPKVVIIVGPVGSLTDSYRSDGDKAGKAARAAGATVETIYSPNATWPRVRDALQGASLVVYLGHGNGWPSPYRDSPWAKTQNGLGLNSEAGVDDHAHQYFGEAYLARAVHLAPHAVVLLSHLCYASGNSEPGLPEGDLATGQQRVDNYAAGWLAAGAEAVVAEGYGGPAYYVRRILAGEGTVESIWRKAPTAHGHVLAFPSVRTPGMTALMDPTLKSSGFYRSLVGRVEMHADEVALGAAGVRSRGGKVTTPTPTSAGPTVTAVMVDGVPTVGSSLRVKLTLDKAERKLAPDLGIGIRWDPISLDPPPVIPVVPAATASPTATPVTSPAAPVAQTIDPRPGVTEGGGPPASTAPLAGAAGGTPAPTSSDRPEEAKPTVEPGGPPDRPEEATPTVEPGGPPNSATASPTVEPGGPPSAPSVILISPEVPGAVVSLSDVRVTRSGISAELVTPLEPGLYRLAMSLHDSDGVAFDARTQEHIPALTVRVTGELSAVVSATGRLGVAAGARFDLPVTVANTGHLEWAPGVLRQAGRPTTPALGSTLVGQWMRLDGSGAPSEAIAARATIRPLPGATEEVSLALTAPPEPGSYLLFLDVVSPLYGSLTAVGSSPLVVRVDVTHAESGGAGSRTVGQPRRPEGDALE